METPHWPAVVMQILIARHWLLMLLKVNIMSHHMNFPHHRYANVYLSGNFSISERIKVKAKRTLYTFLSKVMHFHLWWTLFIYGDFMIYFCNILKTISVSDFPSAHEAPTQAGRHRDNQVEVKKIVFYHLNTIMIWCSTQIPCVTVPGLPRRPLLPHGSQQLHVWWQGEYCEVSDFTENSKFTVLIFEF